MNRKQAQRISKVEFEGRHIRMRQVGGWEYVERRGASGVVCIAAVDNHQRLILIEQFRPPVNKRVIELPAGLAGDESAFHDESLETAARRELLEETGYEGDAFVEIGTFASSAGLTNETVTFFTAHSLERTGAGGGDAAEDITVHEVQLDQVEGWLQRAIRSGLLVDARVYTGLYLLKGTALKQDGC